VTQGQEMLKQFSTPDQKLDQYLQVLETAEHMGKITKTQKSGIVF
jgi:sulfur transfer protein SufE